jgi:hypothetical protein
MTLCGGMASSTSSSRKVDGKLASPAGYVRKDEFTSASERSAVGCLPLAKELDKGTPSTLLFDIYIDDLLSARMRH